MPVTEHSGRSVAGTARRAQIVAATIDTIAAFGYQKASFARIAACAELSSTRLISYHFAGKDELMRAVIADVSDEVRVFMTERMADVQDARSSLLAYIRGRVEFTASHRHQMDALMSIFLEFRGPADQGSSDGAAERHALGHVQQILEEGQRSGQFRTFDTLVMASTIQRAIDSLPFLLRTAPEIDLASYADEVATLFDLATRKDQ